MKKACVIGYPISHSLSPVIHNYWLKKYGIEGEYLAVEVAPEDLEGFLVNLKNNGFEGCNITLPHKEKAWEIVSRLSASGGVSSRIISYMKAINTVAVNESGYTFNNTDYIGFARNLLEAQPNYDYENSIAYIIGAGGAAKAVAFALTSMLVKHIVITNRTESKAHEIKDMLKSILQEASMDVEQFVSIVPWEKRNEVFKHCNIVVNTTSLGMKGQEELDVDLTDLRADSLVTDIVYNPLETKLLKDAKAKGAVIVDGLGMLLHQAAPGFEAWFGKKPEVTQELREAVLKALEKRK